jgi:hypothetical protein
MPEYPEQQTDHLAKFLGFGQQLDEKATDDGITSGVRWQPTYEDEAK